GSCGGGGGVVTPVNMVLSSPGYCCYSVFVLPVILGRTVVLPLVYSGFRYPNLLRCLCCRLLAFEIFRCCFWFRRVSRQVFGCSFCNMFYCCRSCLLRLVRERLCDLFRRCSVARCDTSQATRCNLDSLLVHCRSRAYVVWL